MKSEFLGINSQFTPAVLDLVGRKKTEKKALYSMFGQPSISVAEVRNQVTPLRCFKISAPILFFKEKKLNFMS